MSIAWQVLSTDRLTLPSIVLTHRKRGCSQSTLATPRKQAKPPDCTLVPGSRRRTAHSHRMALRTPLTQLMRSLWGRPSAVDFDRGDEWCLTGRAGHARPTSLPVLMQDETSPRLPYGHGRWVWGYPQSIWMNLPSAGSVGKPLTIVTRSKTACASRPANT